MVFKLSILITLIVIDFFNHPLSQNLFIEKKLFQVIENILVLIYHSFHIR